jgi:nicotinate (nicotinamide) nucleotide adenylyltransferase
MELIRKARMEPRRLGIFAGSFNPPTRAHAALAEAALGRVDEVLFVIPREFPHKDFHGAVLDERVEMLRRIADADQRFSIGIADRGLFIDIAREVRGHYGDAELLFLCGRDAAERITNWDYGDPLAFSRMLEEFGLLVARRRGEYVPPSELSHRIEALEVDGLDEISSTEVRERIRRNEDWRELVPASIVEIVEKIYRSTALDRSLSQR